MVSCFTHASGRLHELIRGEMQRALGHLRPRHIVIKPNWVLHAAEGQAISALVTDARVIAATAAAAAELFPGAERITVGDCPLQRADWPLLVRQAGLQPLIADLERRFPGRIVFRDLRRDVYTYADGRLVPEEGAPHGDPLGYREVHLGATSHLEELSHEAGRLSIHDHDREKTQANHRPGDHRYFVSQSFLDADLVINLPKWKTHSKSGLTGALKNLVGINGDKAYLPHFRTGAPRWGGDEYWDEGRWLYWTQSALRDFTREYCWWAYKLLRPIWLGIKKVRSALLRGDSPQPDFYVGGGSWYGNQTIWRMIYDLNMVIQLVDAEGVLRTTPQRHYFCIVDGLVCGEGDGPLFPTPRPLDWLVFGQDPFAIDAALAWFMGFDSERLPIIAERRRYLGPEWGRFDSNVLPVSLDGRETTLAEITAGDPFVPPPGWAGHIERAGLTNGRRASS
ncbi:MAG: DUF362 domain-containing protein [Vicinamibacterales bacterium]